MCSRNFFTILGWKRLLRKSCSRSFQFWTISYRRRPFGRRLPGSIYNSWSAFRIGKGVSEFYIVVAIEDSAQAMPKTPMLSGSLVKNQPVISVFLNWERISLSSFLERAEQSKNENTNDCSRMAILHNCSL